MAVRSILVNAVNLPTTTHTCTPTATTHGATAGYDEVFSTYHGTTGDGSHTIAAIHTFPTPRNITQLKYRLYAYGYAYGDTTADVTVEYQIEYTTNGALWTVVATATS